jgi:hypothetical protein
MSIPVHDLAFRRNIASILGCGVCILNEETQTVTGLRGQFLGRFEDFTNRGLMQGNMSSNNGTPSSSSLENKF